MYIAAGNQKLEATRNGELAELKNKAALSGQPEDAQAVRDMEEKCNRFEKKLHESGAYPDHRYADRSSDPFDSE